MSLPPDTMPLPSGPPPPGFSPMDVAGLPPGLPPFPDMANAGPNLQNTVSWSCGLLLILATVFLGLRMYCKYLRYRAYSFDDWLLVASWVVFLASVILDLILVAKGQGKHIWEIPPETLPTFALPGTVTVTLQVVALAWSKTSFAITLFNVVTHKTEKWILVFAMFSLNVMLAVSALLPWIPCTPLEKAWKPEIPGVCNSPPIQLVIAFNIAAGAYSGVLDLAFVLLSWKTVVTLQMRLREKCAVGIAMSMGVFAAICAVIKCTYLPRLSDPDFTYALSPIVIWSAAEASATIMAACVPSLRVLVRTAKKRVKEMQNSRSRGGQMSSVEGGGRGQNSGLMYLPRGRRTMRWPLMGSGTAPMGSGTAPMGSSMSSSARPELKSQLDLEKWAMGAGAGAGGSGGSGGGIHVETVVILDWESDSEHEAKQSSKEGAVFISVAEVDGESLSKEQSEERREERRASRRLSITTGQTS